MLNLVVVVILWAMAVATAGRLVSAARTQRQRLPYSFLAATFGALGLTLGLDPVYVALESVLGGRNWVDPAKHTCLIVCALFLAFTVLTSVNRLTRSMVCALLLGGGVALTVQFVSFVFVDASPSTTEFMQTFGHQLPTVIYSASHFGYFGFAEALTLVAAVAVWRTAPSHYRIAIMALGSAAVAAVLIVATITVRDWARFAGVAGIADAMDPAYKALLVVIAVGNCVGLGLPAILGPRSDNREERISSQVLESLTPTHTRARQALGVVGLEDGIEQFQLDHMSPLRKITIALRDAEAKGFRLTHQEQGWLRVAEQLLEHS